MFVGGDVMRSRLDKQVAKRSNKNTRKPKYFKFHGVNIRRWAYPIGVLLVLYEEYQTNKYVRLEWSEEKAEKMANKYFGKICNIDEEDGSLWFCTDWSVRIWRDRGSSLDYDWLLKFGSDMHDYIVNTFTIEGYDKSVQMADMVNSPYVEWVHFIKI
jgi:hypothetical protein